MSQDIKLKRSGVQGKIPSTTDLSLGELAINTYDGKLYLKKNDGAESIVDITTNDYNDLINVPTEFPAEPHTHDYVETTGDTMTGSLEVDLSAQLFSSDSPTKSTILKSRRSVSDDDIVINVVYDVVSAIMVPGQVGSGLVMETGGKGNESGILQIEEDHHAFVLKGPTFPFDVVHQFSTNPEQGAIIGTTLEVGDNIELPDDDAGIIFHAATKLYKKSGQGITIQLQNGTTDKFTVEDSSENDVFEVGPSTFQYKNQDIYHTGNLPSSDYTHPAHPGDDISLDTGALTGATVISDLDFNVTTDTQGHVTDANATVSTRNLTAPDIGAMGHFILEDGDGTEVSISHAEEVKFVEGSGMDINWTDTSTGSDGNPFDLTFTNTDRGSSQSIFKNVAVTTGKTSNASTIVADSNNDTLYFQGAGATTIATDSTTDTVIITSVNTDTVYVGWDLLVNGAGTERVLSGQDVNFVEGYGIDISKSGKTVTVSGAGWELGGNIDLNTITKSGTYHQAANSEATSESNYPENNAGVLIVHSQPDGASVHIYQEYRVYNSARAYRRNFYNGSWYNWTRIYSSLDNNIGSSSTNYAAGNHNHNGTYSLEGHTHPYLPLAGGTLTGNLVFNPASGPSIIDFVGSGNDRGWIKHYNSTAGVNGYMEFCVSDDPIEGVDSFKFGAASGNLTNIDAPMTYWLTIDQAGTTVTRGNMTVAGDVIASGTKYVGDAKEIIRFSDSWLRINPANNFTSGTYFGPSLVRTDGELQVGNGGEKFKVTAAGNVTSAGNITSSSDVTGVRHKTANWSIEDSADGSLSFMLN